MPPKGPRVNVVFDDINGLDPDEAERWTSWAERSLDLLAQGASMDAVQRFLLDEGTGVMAAIAITRVLIGDGGSLAQAKEIVLASGARTVELRAHEQALEAVEEL